MSSGGLGLTGGLADVESLYDCLIGIHQGKTSDAILDKYDAVRRDMWHKFIDTVSSDNLRRLNSQDPETALEKDKLLQTLQVASKDAKLARELQLVSIFVAAGGIVDANGRRAGMRYCMISRRTMMGEVLRRRDVRALIQRYRGICNDRHVRVSQDEFDGVTEFLDCLPSRPPVLLPHRLRLLACLLPFFRT